MIWQFIDSSSVGGAERHVATLTGSLRRAGWPAEIVLLQRHASKHGLQAHGMQEHGQNASPSRSRQAARQSSSDNPWLIQLDDAQLPFRHLDGRSATLVKALRTERPKLLHTHGYKAGVLGRLAARIAGVPVVSTFHSGERGPFPVGAYEWLDDWSSLLGQRIAVSQKIKDRLPFTSHVIPSYVATSDQPPTALLPDVAVFVGRLSAEKGPDIFCRLAERAPAGMTWHIWGDGPMRQELEAAYGRTVRFHGVATNMEQVWQQAGLLIMPSHFEGVPLAALEAAAHGVPVLASRVGGLPSVITEGQTGWLFAVGDVDGALAGVAAWQAARQDTPALRHRCWLKARTDFSEARWFPDILKVYRAAGAT